MPGEKTVRDLMIPIDEYPTIKADALVHEAIAVLQGTLGDAKGHRAVLVTDENSSAVGVLTFRGLIKGLEPHTLSGDIPQASIDWLLEDADPGVYPQGLFAQRSQSEAQKAVREIMEGINLITIGADAPLLKAIRIMIDHGVGSLPVLDGNRVVGMIQINEIFGEIANLITMEE